MSDERNALPEGSQDWQLLVTEGHVRGHRLVSVGKRWYGAALALGIAGGVLWLGAVTGAAMIFHTPSLLVRALTADPEHYATLPGYPEKTTYRLSWLAGALGEAQHGLSVQAWSQLVQAARNDISRYGTKTAAYTAIPKLAVQPIVTRPQKALTEHKDDLATGIVAIPLYAAPTEVIAWVEGKISVAQVDGYGNCAVAYGPPVDGCGQGQNPSVFQMFRPTKKGA